MLTTTTTSAFPFASHRPSDSHLWFHDITRLEDTRWPSSHPCSEIQHLALPKRRPAWRSGGGRGEDSQNSNRSNDKRD